MRTGREEGGRDILPMPRFARLHRPGALHHAGQLWSRLALVARSVGVGGTMVRGKVPQATMALSDAMRRLAAGGPEGEYRAGFSEYEWRFRSRDYPVYELSWKLWNGESLDGRSIVLCSEQGLGDTLQFVRYATLVKARGARVIVLCRPELCPILAGTPGVDALITPGMVSGRYTSTNV